MLNNELTFDVVQVLKETADKFQPELFKRVRGELGSRDLSVLDYIFERYYRKDEMGGRWYDPYHILFSTPFAVQLVETHAHVSPLIIPAIILHDIGYRVLTNEAKANWNAAQNRIIHMQEGAGPSAQILVQNGFGALEVGITVGMVASHDNIYLDILTERNPDRLAIRDADRMWVMHFLSFYKDWVSGPEDISLTGLLEIRKDSIRGVRGPATDLAQEWLSEQFRMRFREISANIIRDKDVFQKYAERHIRAELKAGRG